MQADYDRYWTDARVDRVLDVLERYGIALEINARYRIPSFGIIRRAKQRGIKFTFGNQQRRRRLRTSGVLARGGGEVRTHGRRHLVSRDERTPRTPRRPYNKFE